MPYTPPMAWDEKVSALRARSRWALILWVALGLGCEDPTQLGAPPLPTLRDPEPPPVPEVDAGSLRPSDLRLTFVDPDHGPFTGGNTVVLRGSGFVAGLEVSIGGRGVPQAQTELIDSSRVAVVAPVGEPGPADVEVVQEGRRAVLPGGYTYESIVVEPGRGSVAGNTLVSIIGTGTDFAEGGGVNFGLLPCEDVTIVSATEITCRTPPGSIGTVDVTYVGPPREDGTSDSIRVEDGFVYYDGSTTGGLSGGDVEGALNVTVVNAQSGAPVAGAWVVAGDDLSSDLRGQTDSFGRVTLSAEGLLAPIDLHVAAECYANTTFRSFDARDVTILATYNCMDDGDPPPATDPPTLPNVAGELIFPGPNEFGPNPWDVYVPNERGSWRRVAYVMTTMPCADETSTRCMNPPPGGIGLKDRVRETEDDHGARGYTYRIQTNIGGIAVFAMAGLENANTQEFRPYVMGVARGVLTAPGAELRGVDIYMDIPLDHQLGVRVENLPGQTAFGDPNSFRVTADVDLGGEGMLVRLDPRSDYTVWPFNLIRYDVVERSSSRNPFTFAAVPALHGTLSDGRFRAVVSWTGGGVESNRILTGIRAVDQEIVVDDMLGIPEIDLSDADVIRWNLTGGPEPDFFYVGIFEVGLTQITRWEHFLPGSESETRLPALETLEGVAALPEDAFLVVLVSAVELPGSDFDRFTYDDLALSRWTAWSSDQAVLSF